MIDMDMKYKKVGKSLRPACKAFKHKGLNYKDLYTIIKLFRSPNTTMQNVGDHFMFNKQQLDSEAGYISYEYAKEDFSYFGFAIGDSLVKHIGSQTP